MVIIYKILKIYLQISFYINGFLTISRLQLLSALIRICLLSWLASAMFLIFYWHINGSDTSVGGLVGSASFALNGLTNIIIVLEAFLKSKHFDKMTKLQQEVDELLDVYLKSNVQKNTNYRCLTKQLIPMLLCQFVCDGLRIWINSISDISPVFWYLLPVTVGLRTRYIQIIYDIMKMNHRTLILKDAIWTTAKANEPKSQFASDIWHPYDLKDYEKVNYMRLIYLRLWEVYVSLNNLYGWSLLMLSTSSFFDIVCNCYWTYEAVYKRQEFHKFVMNGATSISLVSLICVLFYYTDAGETNKTVTMALLAFKITLSYYQSQVYKTTILFMYLGFWIFGLSPFTNNYRIYQAFVVLWCCEIALTTYLAITWKIFGDEESLNGLVSIILYVTHMLGHLTVLVESCRMFQHRVELFKQLFDIRKEMEETLIETKNPRFCAIRLSRIVIVILVLLVCGHGIIIWTTFKTKSPATSMYWRSLQSYLALQFKTLEFLTGLQQLNYYMTIIRDTLNDMGERNLQHFSKQMYKYPNLKVIYVVPLNEEDKEEQLLKLLKTIYNKVYATFLIYNKTYGWSLLSSIAAYFVDLVCNSYWISFTILTQGRDLYGLLQNTTFALMAFVLLSMSCWYAEKCYYESHYIGCLISKFAKPLGNKHYNDLVIEFSVQTLHQRFIITANEFFTINLNLLGKMIAAIVIYLVILIQFMFTEKS